MLPHGKVIYRHCESSNAAMVTPLPKHITGVEENITKITPHTLTMSAMNAKVAGKSVNHRAKVTVQRRANTNQKVVSLSFEKALELSSGQNFTDSHICDDKDTSNKPLRQNLKDNTRWEACVSSLHTTSEGNQEDELQELKQDIVPLKLSNEDSLTHEKNEVAPLQVSPAKAHQTSTPPPVRAKQAWASPSTPARQAHPTPEVTSKGTNTVSRRLGNKEKDQPAIDNLATAKDLASKSKVETKHLSSDSITAGSCGIQVEPDDQMPQNKSDDQSTTVTHKPGQRKSVDIEIPTAPFLQSAGKSRKKKNSKKNDPEITSEEDKKSHQTRSPVPASNKHANSQDRGDGKHIEVEGKGQSALDANEMDDSNSLPFQSSSEETIKKCKKKLNSLFTWSPFKDKSGIKQKIHGPKSMVPAHICKKKQSEGEMAKKTITSDILHMSGKVSIPQSLTDMFAATKPNNGSETETKEPCQVMN